MSDLIQSIWITLSRFGFLSFLDIIIIAAIFYWLLLLLRGTTAMSLLRGIVIVLLFSFILSSVFQLTMVGWLLRNSFPALLIGIPILFQPELRRALERVGRTAFRNWVGPSEVDTMIERVSEASQSLSQLQYGALMILERDTGLQDYIDTGIYVDATASTELLVGIFLPNSPLHDGAVILRQNRVVAAGCVLPLSDNFQADSHLGTRHRAAIGISERTDAVSVVVSGETGIISVAANGRFTRGLDEARLRRALTNLCKPSSSSGGGETLEKNDRRGS